MIPKIPGPLTQNSPIDMRNYSNIEIQVTGLSGGDSIAIQKSHMGTTFASVDVVKQSAVGLITSITEDGIYSVSGSAFVRWVKTGSASSPVVTVAGI